MEGGADDEAQLQNRPAQRDFTRPEALLPYKTLIEMDSHYKRAQRHEHRKRRFSTSPRFDATILTTQNGDLTESQGLKTDHLLGRGVDDTRVRSEAPRFTLKVDFKGHRFVSTTTLRLRPSTQPHVLYPNMPPPPSMPPAPSMPPCGGTDYCDQLPP